MALVVGDQHDIGEKAQAARLVHHFLVIPSSTLARLKVIGGLPDLVIGRGRITH